MPDSDSSNPTSTARRPWYRPHRSTWLLIPLPLAVAVVTVVPGEIGKYPDRHSYYHLQWENAAIIHGWPIPFLWRTPFELMDADPANAPAALAWNLSDSVRQFSLLSVALDIGIALAGIAAVLAVMEWRRRRRSRFFQFTLRELFVCTTAVAILFAWWSQRRRATAELNDHLNRISTKSWKMEPAFPLWIRNMAGDEFLSGFGVARPPDSGTLFWSGFCREDFQFIVERFPEETIVIIQDGLSEGDIAGIARLDHLENLASEHLDMDSGRRFLALGEKLRNLRWLVTNLGDQTPIDDADLAQIARMSQLEYLGIGNGSQLTERGLGELRRLNRLKDLSIARVNLSPAALNLLAKLTQLRRLDLFCPTFGYADLSILGRISELEELGITGMNLGDDGLRQLQSLRKLHYLGLCGAKVTAAGLRAMVKPSDGCPRPFQNLRFIDVQGISCKLAAVSNLAALENLDTLRVSFDDINDAGIVALQKLPALTRLEVTGQGGSRLPLSAIEARLKKALPDCKIAFGLP